MVGVIPAKAGIQCEFVRSSGFCHSEFISESLCSIAETDPEINSGWHLG